MIAKTKIAVGLLSTVLSGVGTYELLRTKGGHSLNKDDDHEIDEKEAKDKEQGSKEEDVNPNEGQNPDEPSTPKTKLQSYKQYLSSKNTKINFVDSKTSQEDLKNILLHRMFPHYRKNFKFSQNQMFTGSPEIDFKGKDVSENNQSLFILDKHDDTAANSLREACIKALDQDKPEDKENKPDAQTYRLKAWCTVPTIKDVLLRHKFKLPDEEDWKAILNSDWIKKDNYHDKQSLFTTDEMKKLKDSGQTQENIKLLKDKCKTTLDKSFNRTNFPATRDFLGNSKKADEFQEAALFCTKPTTAEDYVKTAMQGATYTEIPKDLEKDYCRITGKEISDYITIKTTDPMEGKSFWCAVRMIYHKQGVDTINLRKRRDTK